MFGSKKKVEKEADADAMVEAFKAWFSAMEEARPVDLGTLTGELLEQVGDPYTSIPSRGTFKGDSLFYMYQAYGKEWAARLSRKAILCEDTDHTSRYEFWKSVSDSF